VWDIYVTVYIYEIISDTVAQRVTCTSYIARALDTKRFIYTINHRRRWRFVKNSISGDRGQRPIRWMSVESMRCRRLLASRTCVCVHGVGPSNDHIISRSRRVSAIIEILYGPWRFARAWKYFKNKYPSVIIEKNFSRGSVLRKCLLNCV